MLLMRSVNTKNSKPVNPKPAAPGAWETFPKVAADFASAAGAGRSEAAGLPQPLSSLFGGL